MSNASVGFQHDNKSPIGATVESLWKTISILRADETHIASTAPTVQVGDIIHSWPQKTPRTPSGRASVQGADPSYDNTNATRAGNVTQIIQIGIELTGSKKDAPNAVGGDPMALERSEGMKDWKNELEYSLLRGSQATGNDSTAAKMKGLRHFASTLTTAQSGTSLSETTYNDYMANAYNVGIEIDTTLVGIALKRRISSWTSSNTKQIDVEEFKTVNKVDVYECDSSTQQIVKHRYVTVSGDNNFDLVAYDSNYVKLGVYRPVKIEPLAKTGDADREQIIGEYTLQVEQSKAVTYASAHL